MSIELVEKELSCAHEFKDSGPKGKFPVCGLCGSSSAKQKQRAASSNMSRPPIDLKTRRHESEQPVIDVGTSDTPKKET